MLGKFFITLPLICAALIPFGCSPLTAQKKPVTFAVGEEDKMKRFSLDNGLQLFIRENPGSKTVAIDAWVNTGSINEPSRVNGISHFLEHMLFKGTRKYKPGEIDQIIEGVGAVWNAGTSEDFTHFYISVAAPYFKTCLDVLAEVIKNSIIDPKEVEKERLVVLEEYRRKQDNPMAFLLEDVYAKSDASGPYKYPVLGTPDTIKAITQVDLADYYQRYYTPDNMILVVIGDIKAEEALAQIKAAFSDFDRKLKAWPVDYQTTYAWKIKEKYEKQVGDTYVVMAFPAPGIDKTEEVCVMEVLSTILGDGRSSRLYQRIKERQELVSSIGVSYDSQKLDSLQLITATLNVKNLDKTEQSVMKEIKRIREEAVSKKELEKAKRMITNGYYFATETNAGQSGIFGYYYLLTGSMDFERHYLGRIQQVTPAQIQDAARRYLPPEDYNLFYIVPVSKPSTTQTEKTK